LKLELVQDKIYIQIKGNNMKIRTTIKNNRTSYLKQIIVFIVLSIISFNSSAFACDGKKANEKYDEKPEKSVKYGYDDVTCNFILPGNFKKAMFRAKKENRPLLIKGVAFGLDEAGATCATKGHW